MMKFISMILEWLGIQSVTKLKLKWNAPQLIFSQEAYDILQKPRSHIARLCEFAASSGYTMAGLELMGKASDWPHPTINFPDAASLEKFMRDQIDRLEPILAECDKRNLGVKIIGDNSNSDNNRRILDQGTLERTYKYLWNKYPKYRRIMAILPVSERDGDLKAPLIDEAVRDAESLFPREQTIAYNADRPDADFTEWHPQRPKDTLRLPRHWSTLTCPDSGGHLSAIKSDGVKGQKPKEKEYLAAYTYWIDQGCSVEVYDFISDYTRNVSLWHGIGRHFVAKHGNRKA